MVNIIQQFLHIKITAVIIVVVIVEVGKQIYQKNKAVKY